MKISKHLEVVLELVHAQYQTLLTHSTISRVIVCQNYSKSSKTWIYYFRCQTQRLHIGEYTVQHLGTLVNNWMGNYNSSHMQMRVRL